MMEWPHLRNWLLDEDIIVWACGPSADPQYSWEVAPGKFATGEHLARKHWTIGCNRSIGRVDCDLGAVFEPARDPVWEQVQRHAPFIIIGHHQRGAPRKVEIGDRNVAKFLPDDDPQGRSLRLGQSAFWAAASAIWLGCKTIGLVGVDITPDRFNNAAHLEDVETQWGRLAGVAQNMGRSLINLNPKTYLKSVPIGSWADIRGKYREP